MVINHHVKTGIPAEAVFKEVLSLYNQVRMFETDFYEKHGFKIHFNEQAINEIILQALDRMRAQRIYVRKFRWTMITDSDL